MTCQRSNRGSEAEDKDWKALRFAGDQANDAYEPGMSTGNDESG